MSVSEKVQSKDQELTFQFVKVATDLASCLAKEGVKIQAHLEGLPYFSNLTPYEKTTAIERVQTYYDLCAEHLLEGQALRDSQRFTWRALVKMGLTPPSDLLGKIGAGDVVEIYNADHVQLFRNLEFFDFCSYTLEELFSLEWYRLFQREEAATASTIQLVEELYAHKYPQGIANPFPNHVVEEPLSQDKFKLNLFMRYIAPLYQNKQIKALVCIEQVSFIHPAT